GLFGRKNTEFVRTPKYGANGDWKKKAGSFKNKQSILPYIEIILGLYMAACTAMAVWTKSATGTIPFLMIFSFGYLYVGVLTLHRRWLSNRAKAELVAAPEVPAEAIAA